MNDIIAKIQTAVDNGLTAFGVRAMTANPSKDVAIDTRDGASIEGSYIWEDGTATDDELGGVSTIGLDVDLCDGEVDEEWLSKAISMLSDYDSETLVVVGGHQNIDAVHNDQSELVITEAVIITKL